MRNAASVLAAAGHKIIPLSHNPVTSALRGGQLALDTYVIDPSATSTRYIMDSGEPIVPSVSQILNGSPPKKFDILELAALNVEIHKYKEAWLEIFREERLDVVIAPAAQNTAVPHDTFYWPHFTAMWNLLDVSF
jgi:amidase